MSLDRRRRRQLGDASLALLFALMAFQDRAQGAGAGLAGDGLASARLDYGRAGLTSVFGKSFPLNSRPSPSRSASA